MIDKEEIKRLAVAFPDYEWDSNQEPFFNGPSGESLGGGPTGFYCVYGPEFAIDGEVYDGATLVESCPADQAKFICDAKGAILSLLAEVEGLHAQHGRDSAELRSLCQARNDARKERDSLKAQVERLKEEYDKAWRHDLNDKNNVQVLAAEVERITALNHSQFGEAIRSNAERDQLKAEVERQAAEIVELKDGNRGLQWAIGEMKGQHKNLHRSLCARFGYVHDEKDWWRDDVSLEEHIAAQIGQLKAEVEALRREIASIKPSPISTDKTTIGYTGCLICGQYTGHGGLQCPNLAARSLQMEHQRVVPVEPIRVPHPLDVALTKKGES